MRRALTARVLLCMRSASISCIYFRLFVPCVAQTIMEDSASVVVESSHLPPTAGLGVDPVFCPGCSDEYQAPPSQSAPMLYGCSHTVCKACVDGRELGDAVGCAVCGKESGPPVVDAVLAGYCGKELAAPANASQTAVIGNSLVTCKRRRVDAASDSDPTSISDAALRATAAKCSDAAAVLLTRSETVAAAKQAMADLTTQACGDYSAAIDRLHADLDEHRRKHISEAKGLCKSRGKAMDAEVDELVVSASQLRTCAAMCDSVLCAADVGKRESTLAYAERAVAAFSGIVKYTVAARIELDMDAEVARNLLLQLSSVKEVVNKVLLVLQMCEDGFVTVFVSGRNICVSSAMYYA